MSEPMTEREAALAAKVAELEAAAAKKPKPGGNIVEQIWHYLSYFVPPTIMVAGVLVFVLFHAWDYYNASLKTAAETRIKEAQATIKNAEALANMSDVDGMKLRVARVRAELDLKRQQAAKAKIESDALNSKIDGATLEIQRVQTEVQTKQLQAKAARVEAEKLMQSAGMTPLASKLEATKLALEQFEVAKSQAGLAYNRAVNIDKLNVVAQHTAIIKSWCSSRFAAEVGCANLPSDLTGRRQ